jgi:Fur family ferric uptake transcriptional regulator
MRKRFKKQLDLLREFCRARGLHRSGVREMILLELLSSEQHVTAHDFWGRLKRKHRSLDPKTVQSTMELLVGAGLAREQRLEDGSVVYEHAFAHRHHDHMICRRCGRMIEFASPEIERMQEQVAGRHGFVEEDHVLQIYGICKSCAAKAPVDEGAPAAAGESLIPLARLKPGQKGVVRRIAGGESMARRLAAMNIRPGKLVTKVSAMLMGGPIVVSVDGRQLAIGHGMAHKVLVGVPWR